MYLIGRRNVQKFYMYAKTITSNAALRAGLFILLPEPFGNK
jgi:hypothetical protein